MDELRWYGKILDTEFTSIEEVVISDVHYGNPFFSMPHLKHTLDWIMKKPNRFFSTNGDLLEAIIKSSKGDIHHQVLSPKQQRDDMVDLLKPYKERLLCMTGGNHEARIFNETSIDLTEDMANALGVPYRAEGMLFKISFGRGNRSNLNKPFVFWGYMTHGYGGARTKSAKAVKVERTRTFIHADWFAMSHDHVVNVAPDIYLMPDNRGKEEDNDFISGRVTAKREILIKTNAYLKWGGYAEAGGFPPSDLSTPVIKMLTPQSPEWEDLPEKAKQAVKVIV
tara:strand:- start:114 stop:956 length:843 start_codon:yes stop_codon:yes gene_type:complete